MIRSKCRKTIPALCAILFIALITTSVSSFAFAEDDAATGRQIKVTIGDNEYYADLADTSAASEFYNKLPVTLDMSELNGNEKYNYMQDSFTKDAKAVDIINAGDIKLYGSNCIVLFYDTFPSSYSYTDIGHITDVTGIKKALGSGSVSVTFSKREESANPSKSNTKTVRLNYTSKTLTVGSTIKLKLIGTAKKVKWSSSDKKIVTVSKYGKVRAKKKGKAKIIAKVGKKKYVCKIRVKKKK